jgi:CubicO group peptidase (beta-lactamase class C family)
VRLAAALAATLAAAPAPAQDAAPRLRPTQVAQIDAFLAEEMRKGGIPGLSVAVVLGREVAWSKGYGLSDLEQQAPARPETVYRFASISKPITATLVADLAEEGMLDLEAPIQRYVPAFPPKPWPVTLRQLLCHQGGIRHYNPGEFSNTRHFQSLSEGLELFKNDALLHPPGTRYAYTNYGFTLLGLAVEAVTGQPFAEALRARVFEPARMETAHVCDVSAIVANRAEGYVMVRGIGQRRAALSDNSYKVPGAGLCGSVLDLARFASALLKGTLLGDPARERMFAPQRTSGGRTTGYGLGWALNTSRGQPEVYHTGGQQGVSGLLYMVPRRGIALALLCNLEGRVETLPDLVRRLVRAADL